MHDLNKSKQFFLNENNWKIKMKVFNPKQFKLCLDYEFYHFKFDDLLKISIENDFKEIEANIDKLIKKTSNNEEFA